MCKQYWWQHSVLRCIKLRGSSGKHPSPQFASCIPCPNTDTQLYNKTQSVEKNTQELGAGCGVWRDRKKGDKVKRSVEFLWGYYSGSLATDEHTITAWATKIAHPLVKQLGQGRAHDTEPKLDHSEMFIWILYTALWEWEVLICLWAHKLGWCKSRLSMEVLPMQTPSPSSSIPLLHKINYQDASFPPYDLCETCLNCL